MISILAAVRSSRFFLAAGASVALFALVACGGGGGGGGGTPPNHVAGNSFRPCNVGLSYASAGSALETISRPLPPPSPAPPSPQPSVTIASSVQVNTSILTNTASFGGQSGLTQLHSIEQDSTALQAISVVTDTFVSCPANDAGNYLSAGWSSTDTNGVALTLTYGAGNGLLDILPETSGANWTNNAALTLNEVDADGQTTRKIVKADGSYNESSQFPDGTSSNAIEASDGSASYSIPLGGPNAGPNDVINVGTPNPAASGGPAIPIVILVPSATPQPISVADWYPPGPLMLSNETDQDLGMSALPAACNVPTSIAASGNKITRTTTRLDTIFGEIEHDSLTLYSVAGVGVVCTVINNQLSAYYDYTGQGVTYRSVPQQITSLAETVGVQSVSLPHRAALQIRGVALRTGLAQQHFWRLVRQRHALQLRALRNHLGMPQSRR